MNGVTILNSYEKFTNVADIFFIIAWGIVFAVLAVCFLYLLTKEDPYKVSTVISIIVAGTLATILFCNIPKKDYETYYEITVDDNVTLNEFQSKYEIIKVEGKIYTVKECVG